MKNIKSAAEDMEDFFRVLKSTLPSKDLIESWFTHYSDANYPKHTHQGGKWLIYASKQNVDNIWNVIKDAQDEGRLGDFSKVATAKSYSKWQHHVICIYTYDSTDTKDILRVRESLRDIGFKSPLHYKRDIETQRNIYGTSDEFFMTV